MRRTLACTAAAALVSATLLAGCTNNENTGGSNVEPDINDPAVTEGGLGEPTDDMATMDMGTTGTDTTDD